MLPKLDLTPRTMLSVAAILLLVGTAYTVGGFANRTPAQDTQTRLTLGQHALADGRGKLAVSLLTPLDKAGNAEADYLLADIYSHGIEVARDEGKALDYLTKAANGGLVKAEAELGRLYAAGDRTVQNFTEAETWLTKAAMQGNAVSERDLGRLYEHGLGVPRNPVAAYAWYENAVLRGDVQAERLRDRIVTSLAPADLARAETQARDLNAEIARTA